MVCLSIRSILFMGRFCKTSQLLFSKTNRKKIPGAQSNCNLSRNALFDSEKWIPSWATPHHTSTQHTSLQMLRCSEAQMHRCTDAQMHIRTDTQTHRRTDTQKHRCTGGQMYRRTDAQTHRHTDHELPHYQQGFFLQMCEGECGIPYKISTFSLHEG